MWPFANDYVNAALSLPAWVGGFFDLDFGPDARGFFRTFFSRIYQP